MNDQALIIRDDKALAIAFTPQAFQLKTAALESAALIGRVDTPEQNEEAVKAQLAIAGLLKTIEEARTAAKAPVLKFGKAIDETAKTFCEELKNEEFRIAAAVGSFQQLEQAKARAAAKAEQERLDGLERERAKALAAAKDETQYDSIQEQFNNRAQQEAPKMVAPPRAAGQTVKEEWEFEVTDMALLAKAHWNLVTVTEKRGDIKALLRQGIKVAGIRAWKTTKASVRVAPERKAIDV